MRELRLALGEWSGDPLEDLPGSSWAAEESAHLVELRLTIEEDLAEAELALGRGASVTAGLAKLVGAHPFRERLRALAAHALYQAGRQADALGLLAEGRRVLMEDLGLDPDPWSREMERRILGQDPELRPRRTAEVGAAAGAADAGKTAAVTEAANTEAANTAEKAGTAETTGAGEAAAEPAGQEKGTGLVGRGAEAGVLARAVSGDGHRVVLLAGEPGIGKTSPPSTRPTSRGRGAGGWYGAVAGTAPARHPTGPGRRRCRTWSAGMANWRNSPEPEPGPEQGPKPGRSKAGPGPGAEPGRPEAGRSGGSGRKGGPSEPGKRGKEGSLGGLRCTRRSPGC